MGWWATARQAAAFEFGRRHWRWFAGVEVARRVVPPALVVSVLGVAGWLVWRYTLWQMSYALPATVALLALVLAAFGWRWAWPRWGWMLGLRPALTAAWCAGAVLLAAAAGTVLFLLH